MVTPPNRSGGSGRKGKPVTLGPLTPEQAISGIFRVKPEDVKRIREEEKKMKGGKKGKGAGERTH